MAISVVEGRGKKRGAGEKRLKKREEEGCGRWKRIDEGHDRWNRLRGELFARCIVPPSLTLL